MVKRGVLVVALVLTLLVAVSTPAAASCSTGSLSESDINAFVDAYNANTDQLPGFLKGRLADERIAIAVTGTDIAYTVATDGSSKITSVENGSVDPTLRVTTSEQVVCQAASSNDPAGSLLTAYDNGDIQVSGVGTVRSITVSLGKFVYGIGQSLGFW